MLQRVVAFTCMESQLLVWRGVISILHFYDLVLIFQLYGENLFCSFAFRAV